MSTEMNFDDGKLTVTRVFDAPREAVFEAWIETSKVQLWWGCAQTTQVRSCIEPKVGGKYEHKMTITGAGEFAVNGIILEYDPPKRLVYEAHDMMNQGFSSKVTVDFEDLGDGRTKVQLVQTELPEEYIQFVKPGWAAALDKLEKLLASVEA